MFVNCPVSPVTVAPLIVPEVVKLFCTITAESVERFDTISPEVVKLF
jgi:hypothetical protein